MGDIQSASGDITIVPPPPSVAHQQYESSTEIRAFGERSNVTLLNSVQTDISTAGFYDDSTPLTPSTIPVGAIVDSYLLHFDPVDSTTTYSYGNGSITFNQDILGIIIQTALLPETDASLGLPEVTYPSTPNDRGLELFEDNIELNPDLRTVSVHFEANLKIEQVRIITATPEPTSVALLIFGVLAIPRTGRRY